MANQVRVGVGVTGASKASSELDRFKDRFTKLEKQGFATGAGIAATNAAFNLVGSAVQHAGEFIDDSIQASSNLNETMSKSAVVFGDSADEIDAWGNTTANAMGLSKRAAVEAAASFGNVFTGVGLAQDKAADMSKTLVQLAGDLASFNNIDPTDALDKLRSGLAGESEPLRAVGVFLTEAQVKAKAMQLGLVGAHGELSEGAKIMARYKLILEQTGTAQGDFARTSEGLANTERIKAAKLEEAQARVGKAFEPIRKSAEDTEISVLDFVSSGIDGLNKLDSALFHGGQYAVDFSGKFEDASKSVDTLSESTRRGGVEARAQAEDVRKAAEKAEALDRASMNAAGHLKAMAATERIAADEAARLDDKIDGLASTIEDELFGKAINAGHEAELKQNIKDLVKQREAAEKGSPKWLELTGEIAQNRKELFQLHLEMAEKEGPQAVIDFLKRQKRLFGDATGEIQKMIDAEERLLVVNGQLAASGTPFSGGGPKNVAQKHKAVGGPVVKGEMYTVGEQGPETFVAPSNGTIIPNGGAGMGGGMTVNINVSTPALTPGGAEALARAIAPHLTRWQQQRGLVGGVRAF